MVKINLLPKDIRPLSYSMFRVLFLMTLLPIVGIAFAFSHNYFILQNLETEAEQSRQQYLTYSKAVEQKANVDKRLDLLKSKEAALEKITKSQELWRKILIELSVITPADVWLVDFNMADNMIINIKGNAGSYGGIASLMKLLDEDALFENPVLITSGVTESNVTTTTPSNTPVTPTPNSAASPTTENNNTTSPSSVVTTKSVANFEIIVQVRGQ